ncbi:ATP-binding protein [Herbivorax sp. ANBcel31]|uniref:ATP-binding protein n=1 Tax=Herbivorax sp. ANBcel31 TaxID=3069754 RepID=UPI0027B43483|nr:ATP-binding protein [Herbivorax sp. ANBcel31]MDQ2085468.1 ATP-binding protein [Herbivorax sp. ANBcel31]
MRDLSLHIMDITQNSLSAKADKIDIKICALSDKDLLEIEIKDNGVGMDEDFLKEVKNPFKTTRTTRKVGLGISLFEASAKSTSGKLSINSKKGVGTEVKACFKISHIDRLPLGNVAETMTTLIMAQPQVEYKLVIDNKKEEFTFSSIDVKKAIGDVPITQFEVIKWIGEYIDEGIKIIFGGVLDEVNG